MKALAVCLALAAACIVVCCALALAVAIHGRIRFSPTPAGAEYRSIGCSWELDWTGRWPDRDQHPVGVECRSRLVVGWPIPLFEAVTFHVPDPRDQNVIMIRPSYMGQSGLIESAWRLQPRWVPFAGVVFAMGSVFAACRHLLLLWRRRDPAQGTCRCGYAVGDLKRCPECGDAP